MPREFKESREPEGHEANRPNSTDAPHGQQGDVSPQLPLITEQQRIRGDTTHEGQPPSERTQAERDAEYVARVAELARDASRKALFGEVAPSQAFGGRGGTGEGRQSGSSGETAHQPEQDVQRQTPSGQLSAEQRAAAAGEAAAYAARHRREGPEANSGVRNAFPHIARHRNEAQDAAARAEADKQAAAARAEADKQAAAARIAADERAAADKQTSTQQAANSAGEADKIE